MVGGDFERLTLADALGPDELRFRKTNTKEPILIARVHNPENGSGATVVLNDGQIRQLMDWLNRNYDPQE